MASAALCVRTEREPALWRDRQEQMNDKTYKLSAAKNLVRRMRSLCLCAFDPSRSCLVDSALSLGKACIYIILCSQFIKRGNVCLQNGAEIVTCIRRYGAELFFC